MASGIIGLIGGNPLMKVKQVIGEHLPLTKSLDGGAGLGAMMQSVLGGGGLQAIMQNPMAAVSGQLQGVLGNAAGQLSAVPGAGALVSALTGAGGLAGSADGLLSAGGGILSGSGIMALAGHANIADMAGAALPAGLGVDTVLGPLNAESVVGTITEWVPQMTADVLSGALPVATAVAQVQGHAATLRGIVDASIQARQAVQGPPPTGPQGIAADIAGVSTVAAMLVSAPPEIRAVLLKSLPPEHAATMMASVAQHAAEPPPDPEAGEGAGAAV